MILLLQAQAILSLLIAFNVPQATVNQVHDILIPPVVSVSPAERTYTWKPGVFIEISAFTPNPIFVPVPLGSVDNKPLAPTPVVALVPMDTTPPAIDLFSIDDGKLRVFTNEPLDFSKTILPEGGTMSIIYDGERDSLFQRTKELGYYYEAALTGASGTIAVTIQDMAGNKVVRTLAVD